VDDLFLANDLYDPSDSRCVPPAFLLDPRVDPGCPEQLRISGADLQALLDYQDSVRSQAQTPNFRVTFAFNGFGTTADGGAPSPDTLASAASANQNRLTFVSHTYDHENLDCYDPVPGVPCTPATYDQSLAEIRQNVSLAKQLGLSIDRKSMVTPDVSGLNNPSFLQAAVNRGISYLVADTARLQAQGTMPPPNTGIRSSLQPSILLIPRRPTNIFYNVSTAFSAAGSEPDEYNYFYGPGGLFPAFGTTQTYSQIIDRESDTLLRNMLGFEAYPIMFHQANLNRYDGTRSVLADLATATFGKFTAISTLPVVNFQQTEIGRLLEARMAYNASGVRGILTPGVSITLTAVNAASVPITGVCARACESYGGQNISYVSVGAGSTVTVNASF
jgi:hypothetical protein